MHGTEKGDSREFPPPSPILELGIIQWKQLAGGDSDQPSGQQKVFLNTVYNQSSLLQDTWAPGLDAFKEDWQIHGG